MSPPWRINKSNNEGIVKLHEEGRPFKKPRINPTILVPNTQLSPNTSPIVTTIIDESEHKKDPLIETLNNSLPILIENNKVFF